MSKFLTIIVCITALLAISGIAMAGESNWDGHAPYKDTGQEAYGQWRWYVDPGDRTEYGLNEGYNVHTDGERGCNYSYAWGAGFKDTLWYYDWSGPPFWVMGDDGTHTGANGSGDGYYALQIDADIEMYANEYMEHSLIYFHRLNSATSMDVNWAYSIESNNGMWVFIGVDDDCYWGGLDNGNLPYLDMVNRRPAPYDWDAATPDPAKRGYETSTTCPGMGSRYYVDNTTKGGSAADVVLPIEFYMYADGTGTLGAGYVLGTYSDDGNSGTTRGIT